MTFFALSPYFLQTGDWSHFFLNSKSFGCNSTTFSLGDMKSEWLQVAGCVNQEDPSVTGWRV